MTPLQDGMNLVAKEYVAAQNPENPGVLVLSRFTGANPHVPWVGVPSLPFDVSDLDALQAIADQITGETG